MPNLSPTHLPPNGKVTTLLCCGLLAFLANGALAKATKINPMARQISTLLAPAPLVASKKGNGLAASTKRLEGILKRLAAADRSNGADPKSILDQAYAMRNDVDPRLKALCKANILAQYRQAKLWKCTETGVYIARVSGGRKDGKLIAYRHIVPTDILPEFAASLANIRITVDGDEGASNAAATDSRVAGYTKQLKALLPEQSWEEAVKADPGCLTRTPEISGEASTRDGTGKGDSKTATGTIRNLSRHPTEVQYSFVLVARGSNGNNTVIANSKGTLKLFPDESKGISVRPPEPSKTKKKKGKSYGDIRGWVLKVNHRNAQVFKAATNGSLAEQF